MGGLLACTENLTLVQHVADMDGDTYKCVPLSGASWYAKTVITTSADGAQPANTYDVRVFGTLDILPRPGDYVVRGTIKAVNKPADLKGVEHFRITSIGDNRRGSLKHWRLGGA